MNLETVSSGVITLTRYFRSKQHVGPDIRPFKAGQFTMIGM